MGAKWRPFCLGLNVLKLLPHLPQPEIPTDLLFLCPEVFLPQWWDVPDGEGSRLMYSSQILASRGQTHLVDTILEKKGYMPHPEAINSLAILIKF